MKIIDDGIVFSEDIKMILEGSNALDYSYYNNGFIIPKSDLIKELRRDFKNDVDDIFNGKTYIISEDAMKSYIYSSITDVYGRYPHCIA